MSSLQTEHDSHKMCVYVREQSVTPHHREVVCLCYGKVSFYHLRKKSLLIKHHTGRTRNSQPAQISNWDWDWRTMKLQTEVRVFTWPHLLKELKGETTYPRTF